MRKRVDVSDIMDAGGGLNWPDLETVEITRPEIRRNRDEGAKGPQLT